MYSFFLIKTDQVLPSIILAFLFLVGLWWRTCRTRRCPWCWPNLADLIYSLFSNQIMALQDFCSVACSTRRSYVGSCILSHNCCLCLDLGTCTKAVRTFGCCCKKGKKEHVYCNVKTNFNQDLKTKNGIFQHWYLFFCSIVPLIIWNDLEYYINGSFMTTIHSNLHFTIARRQFVKYLYIEASYQMSWKLVIYFVKCILTINNKFK